MKFYVIIALLIVLFCASTACASVRFQGTLIEGVGEATLRRGGATLVVQLNGQRFTSMTPDEVIPLLKTIKSKKNDATGWNAHLDELFGPACKISFSSQRRILRVTLGPAPSVNITEVDFIDITLPASIIEGITAPIVGPSFFLLPESRISVQLKDEMSIATRPVELLLDGDISMLDLGYALKQGTNCKGIDAKLATKPKLDVEAKSITLTPLLGGALSLCYYPTKDTALQAQKVFVEAKGNVFITGPEGFTSDPLRPRALSEFTGTFYGTGLTEQDLVAFSTTPCDAIPTSSELYEVTLSSTSRALVFAEIQHQGTYNVCYNRFGASHFTQVATLDIKEGGEVIISKDTDEVIVVADTIVESNVHIHKLKLAGGSLAIDHYSLNVSEFHWEKGTITSRSTGVLNIMGTHNTMDSASSPLVLETVIRNFGTLELNCRYLTFSQHGAIHNFGHLIININVTAADSVAALHSVSDRSVIFNGRGGRITFRSAPGSKLITGDDYSNTIESEVLFENKGVIYVPSHCTVVLRQNMGFSEGFYRVTGGELILYQGEVNSVLEVEGQLKFFRGPLVLKTVNIHGIDQAKVTFQDGHFTLDGLHVSGKVNMLFRGNPTTISLNGHNQLDKDVIVAMKDTHILGRKTFTSYLSVAGRFLCHITSVSFGDNIVLNAKLETVLFGVGLEGSTAKLVPQNIPQNSSLVIPPNATLIIMDVGNTTDFSNSVTPKICAHYVIVPMNVRSHGKILLRGCALLPFGGIHHGVVFGDAAQIETTVQYALCRNVLAFPDVCIPLFSHDYRPTGLAFGGAHEFHPLALPSSSVDVDYVELLKHSSLASLDALRLIATRALIVNNEAALILPNGGYLTTALLTLDGILTSSADHPVTIEGNVLVAPNGTLKLKVATDSCTFPLTITDTLQFIEHSRLQCDAPLNISAGKSGSMISAPMIKGLPWIDTKTCSRDEHVVTIKRDDSIGVQIRNAREYPSPKTKLICLFFLFGIVIITLALLTYNQSSWSIGTELLKKTEFPLFLSWPEFSSYIYNIISSMSIFADSIMLCFVAFHSFVPLPTAVHGLQRFGTYLMTPHNAPHNSTPLLLGFLCTVLVIWIVAWIPLAGKTFSEHLKRLLHNREHVTQRHLIQFLFQFHTVASWFALFAFIPISSFLMDSVACYTFLSETSTCSTAIQRFAIPSFPLLVMFLFLAPYSCCNRSFPFGHPPYMRELDVRFKSTFIYLQYALYFVQVAIWKIYATNVLQLLIGSLLVLLLLTALTHISSPCAYKNINIIKTVSLLFPVWAVVCSLVQVARYGPYQMYVCQDRDTLYLGLLVIGWIVIGCVLVSMLRKKAGKTADDYMLEVDPSTVIHLRALQEHHEKIEECRLEMYNTASAREREKIAESISTLRIQYLQLLNLYRRKKERFLLPYYLGELIGGSLVTHQLSDVDFDENHTPQFLKGEMAAAFQKHNNNLQDIEMEEDLLPDQMENWIRGPLLGRGSYGMVSMGMLPNGKLVAVKEIEISKKYKKETLASVKKEVNMLRTLSHANIIRYFGCCANGRQMQVFMEFAVGGSLTSLVRKFDSLTEPVARGYTHQILTGLNYLHSKNVVHRDIKGENILIDGHGIAKLADFGCSKGLADIANKSREGCASLVGSPFWMAPEVIRNEAYGTKADIWSVGCTVVEVLNGGDPPWSEKFDNVYSAMYFIGNTTELPSNIPTNVSDLCKDFLAKCFTRDISLRPTAADLLKHPWIISSNKSSPLSESSPDGGNPVGRRQWSDMFDSDATDTEKGTTLATTLPNESATASRREDPFDNFSRTESAVHEHDDTLDEMKNTLNEIKPQEDKEEQDTPERDNQAK